MNDVGVIRIVGYTSLYNVYYSQEHTGRWDWNFNSMAIKLKTSKITKGQTWCAYCLQTQQYVKIFPDLFAIGVGRDSLPQATILTYIFRLNTCINVIIPFVTSSIIGVGRQIAPPLYDPKEQSIARQAINIGPNVASRVTEKHTPMFRLPSLEHPQSSGLTEKEALHKKRSWYTYF